MIATIAPLVKVASARWLASSTAYMAASALGGGLVGLFAGWVGQAFIAQDAMTILIASAVVAGLVDLGILGRGVPTLGGSVPRSWWEHLGPIGGAAVYGLVLGLGVTTLVPIAAFYFMLAAAAVMGPGTGAWIGLAYGLARAIPVLFASLAVVGGVDSRTVGDWGHHYRVPARILAGAMVLGMALALVGGLG